MYVYQHDICSLGQLQRTFLCKDQNLDHHKESLKNIKHLAVHTQTSVKVNGPHDDKTQNTHVWNSQASLGTSGNKKAEKTPRTAASVSQF